MVPHKKCFSWLLEAVTSAFSGQYAKNVFQVYILEKMSKKSILGIDDQGLN